MGTEEPKYIVFQEQNKDFTGRLDSCLAQEYSLFTRSQYRTRVRRATINGRFAKAASTVRVGDTLRVEYLEEVQSEAIPEDIPLKIIYEDSNVLVVNKDRGLAVHPGAGQANGTLVNAFLHYIGTKGAANTLHNLLQSKESDTGEDTNTQEPTRTQRPGVVHRLDKDTTGVIILAKNTESLEFLSEQFRLRRTKKTYLALVQGHIHTAGRVEGYIRRKTHERTLFTHSESTGKPALSTYTPLQHTTEPFPASLIRLHPITGRTHQLRVHTQHLGHSIIGDKLYAKKYRNYPLMLHAHSLNITLPNEEKPRIFTAPPPQDMHETCAQFKIPLAQILELR